MDAILIKIDPPKASKHGGNYTRMYFRSITKDVTYNKVFRLDSYDKFAYSKRFADTAVMQGIYEGLVILDENKQCVSAKSDFKIIQRNVLYL